MASTANRPLVAATAPRLLAMGSLLLCAQAHGRPGTLHEYVPPPSAAEQHRWLAGKSLPDHIRAEDRLLKRPDRPAKSESVVGDGDHRSRKVELDRKTTHDGQLQYTAVFNPSVVPFKRVSTFDAVGPDFKLRVRDPSPRPFAVTRRPTPPDSSAFWGTLVLSARAGQTMPLPSVAPNAAIVSYRTQPPARLSFFKDSADNYWVRADRTGRLRVVLLTDAPNRYFAPVLPPMAHIENIPSRLRSKLPAHVLAEAKQVLTHLGIRNASIGTQLRRLVAYFRNFKAEALGSRGRSTYLDIALSQRGVCRHRAFAFMVTALALGIPTRYVENEAHAFAEVFVPKVGWTRIDLGGVSLGLRVDNATQGAVHRPSHDPFPRPSRFQSTYSQLRGSVTGLPRNWDQRPEKRGGRTLLRRFVPSSSEREGMAGGSTSGTGIDPTAPATLGPGQSSDTAGTGGSSPASAAMDTSGEPQRARRRSTSITIRATPAKVSRRGIIRVWGSLQSGQKGVPRLRVEIYLSRDGKEARLLGATVTNGSGVYTLRLAIPDDVAVGEYRLFSATPGDDTHLPCLSP